jgi:hypothetical protein
MFRKERDRFQNIAFHSPPPLMFWLREQKGNNQGIFKFIPYET